MWWRFLIIISLLCSHGFAYKAAVVEYYPLTETTPRETIMKNLDEYRQWADKAKDQSVNILVFPEYGLTTLVQDPENYAVEINNSNTFINQLSVVATEHQLYLVVNLLEKEKNDDDTKYYNTNLVFDKNGTIILKYRKINLYNETKITPGATDQDITFSTDFGITFGIFTCFDILVRNPSRRVLQNNNITDIVFPTAWISKMPLYNSLSIQHGYAISNGVNLLAANYAKPKNGRGGSGIYLANGKIAETYIADTSSSKLIVQEVPIEGRQNITICPTKTPFGLPTNDTKSNVSNYITQTAFNTSRYQFQSIDITKNLTEKTICDGDFCCTFEILVASTDSSEYYKIMAFDGIVDYDITNAEITEAHIRICSLVACEDNTHESCGTRINGTTKFTKITVKGNLPTDDTSFYSPVTVNSYLLPLRAISFCDTKNGTNSSFIQLTTTRAQDNVLAFGLLGRTDAPIKGNNSDTLGGHMDDGDHGSGVSTIYTTFIFLVCMIIMNYILS